MTFIFHTFVFCLEYCMKLVSGIDMYVLTRNLVISLFYAHERISFFDLNTNFSLIRIVIKERYIRIYVILT